jgi:serine/threonine protein kinase
MSEPAHQETPSRFTFPIPPQWSDLLGRDHEGWLEYDGRQYRVKSFIDYGTFGSVFEVEPKDSPGTSLAAKIFHRKHPIFLRNLEHLTIPLSRFHREYELQKRYEFGCVPKYHGHGTTRFDEHGVDALEFPFFLTDLLSGSTLYKLVESNELAGSTLDVIRFGRRLAQSVAQIHVKIVHRDLAAKNVWISRDGAVLILDLGCASDPDDSGTFTRSDDVLGTASILAPSIWREHAKGVKINFTNQTDLYAVACLILLYWQGKYPYERSSTDTRWREGQTRPHLQDRVGGMDGYEPVWELLSRRILAADPEDPIRSAEELDSELSKIEDRRNYIRIEHRSQPIAPLIESTHDPDRYRNVCCGIRMLFPRRDPRSPVTDREIIAGSTAVYKIGHLSRLALQDLKDELERWRAQSLRSHGGTLVQEGEANALIPLNALLTRFEAMTDLLRHCYERFPRLHTRMNRVREHLRGSVKTIQHSLNDSRTPLDDRVYSATAEADHMIREIETNLVEITARLDTWESALRQSTEYRQSTE